MICSTEILLSFGQSFKVGTHTATSPSNKLQGQVPSCDYWPFLLPNLVTLGPTFKSLRLESHEFKPV